MTEEVGIRLVDGRFAGWSNIYALDFPPPDEIVAFLVDERIAICDVKDLALARGKDSEAAVYEKVEQSKLDEIPAHIAMVRGATYKAKEEEVDDHDQDRRRQADR